MPAGGIVGGSGDSGRPPSRFVGRAEQLRALADAWDAVCSGSGARVVAVRGESGIGKTALVREAVRRAAPDAVAWACADQAEAQLPWGVLDQLRPVLGRACPAAGDAAAAGVGDAALVAVRLARHLGERPLIVVVDDAHWADVASSTALRLAVRRLVRDPVLVVLVHRPASAEVPALDEGWRRLLDDGGLTLTLRGLDASDLALLAAATGRPGLSTAGVARLHAHTGGHPQLARHLLAEVDPRVLAFGTGALPGPGELAASVATRWRALSSQARAVVGAAAVLGRRCAGAEAVALAAPDGVVPGDAWTEASRAGLLEEDPSALGAGVAFASSAVHGAVYHLLEPAERRRLHARAADLAPDPGGPAALWHRTVAAVGPDDVLASELQGRAATLAGAGRIGDAAAHLRHSLALTSPGPDRAARLVAAVEALLAAGDVQAAAALGEELEAVAAHGPARGEAAASVGYARGYLALVLGRSGRARALLTSAAAALDGAVVAGAVGNGSPGLAVSAPADAPPQGRDRPAGPGDLAARIATQHCLAAVIDLDFAEMLRQGEAAVAGARDPAVAQFARVAFGLALAGHGRPEDAAAVLGAGASATTPTPDADRHAPLHSAEPHHLEALAALGMARLWSDDLDAASSLLGQAMDRATRGEPLRIAQVVGYLGEAAWRRGDLGEATLLTELAVGDAQENCRVWDYPRAHAQAALPLAAQGRVAEAREHAGRALAWAQELGQRAGLAYAAMAEVSLARATRDAEALLAAADRYEPVRSREEPGVHLAGPWRALALAWSGDPVAAQKALLTWQDATLDPAGPTLPGAGPGGRRASAWLLRALAAAEIALAAGEAHEALPLLDSAADLATATGLRLEAAAVALVRVEALLAAGRRAAAARVASALQRDLAVLGAGALAARLADVAAVHALPLDDPQGALAELTSAERAVVTLVAEGLSNREVAARLVLSPKTVEYHLTQVFRRLDVTSRAQVRDVVRQGRPRVGSR